MPAEQAPNEVAAESGAKIPVRYGGKEGDYPEYTDTEGKQLSTGHDISPGTEEKWGLGNDVVHNPEKAHVEALASRESQEELKRGREGRGSLLPDYDDKMKHYDRKAAAQEFWAGFLYNHAINEEYEKELDIKLDVNKLADLQVESQELVGLLKTWEEDSMKYDDPDARYLTHLIEDLNELPLLGIPGSKNWRQGIDNLLKGENSNSTTIGQIVDLYKEFHRRGIEAIEERKQGADQILEDVRSGRASDPNYQKSTKAAAQAAENPA